MRQSIVKGVKEARKKAEKPRSMVVMTTHSPYVLSALNVIMAASEAYAIDPDATLAVVDKSLILPKGDIRAWRIDDDGCIESIIDDEIYMVSGIFLDHASDVVDDKLAQLNEIICRSYGEED